MCLWNDRSRKPLTYLLNLMWQLNHARHFSIARAHTSCGVCALARMQNMLLLSIEKGNVPAPSFSASATCIVERVICLRFDSLHAALLCRRFNQHIELFNTLVVHSFVTLWLFYLLFCYNFGYETLLRACIIEDVDLPCVMSC